MNINYADVWNVLTTIGTFALGALAFYFNSSKKAQAKLKEVQTVISEVTANAAIFIVEAEKAYQDVSNAGGQKFEYVVDKLYSLVPDFAKFIITKEMIGEIVQNTFDQIEEYVSTQLDNKLGE